MVRERRSLVLLDSCISRGPISFSDTKAFAGQGIKLCGAGTEIERIF